MNRAESLSLAFGARVGNNSFGMVMRLAGGVAIGLWLSCSVAAFASQQPGAAAGTPNDAGQTAAAPAQKGSASAGTPAAPEKNPPEKKPASPVKKKSVASTSAGSAGSESAKTVSAKNGSATNRSANASSGTAHQTSMGSA
ncbi:MAG: hypothetical protein WBW85_05140, partial [Terriglobales bacterium]